MLLMVACVPVKKTFYIPSDVTYRYEGRSCGSVPYGGYHRILGEGVEVYVRIVPYVQGLGVILEFSINEGGSLYFVENSIGIRDSDGRTFDATITKAEKGLSGAIDLTKEMKGVLRTTHTAIATVVSFSGGRLYLVLPDYLVNGTKMHTEPIEFYKVERSGFIACIQ
jgi:hypothetical protein